MSSNDQGGGGGGACASGPTFSIGGGGPVPQLSVLPETAASPDVPCLNIDAEEPVRDSRAIRGLESVRDNNRIGG